MKMENVFYNTQKKFGVNIKTLIKRLWFLMENL